MVYVKICGIKTLEHAETAVQAGVDFIGFVFAPSKREVTPQEALRIAQTIPTSVKKVGVFVNEHIDRISEIVDQVGLDYIQLHGDETPEMVQALPYKTIKAFPIDQVEDIQLYPCDYFLIDSPAEKYRGGSGKTFDWRLIDKLSIDPAKLILAGGLTAENVQEAIQSVNPAAVDTSSGVETNGQKDHEKIRAFIAQAKGRTHMTTYNMPDKTGRYGKFGGRFVPELLMPALLELDEAYKEALNDPAFTEELSDYLTQYIGRETPLYHAKNLTEKCGGPEIYLKREDLNHTGAHKINNTIGQALLAVRMGKRKIVAETGAGQHGVATATVCALLGLECVVFMGEVDIERQKLNVFRMELLGAKVESVSQGSGTLKDAVNEALRYWVAHVDDTHYILGSVVGPHPFPKMVRDFQSVIGKETREQILKQAGKLPDAVLACVGGGSNAMGMFYPFIQDQGVKLYGVEAGGSGIESNKHAATLSTGSMGVLHGTMTHLLQDKHGQIEETFSISAGLDYPGVGPEHSHLHDTNRVTYTSITDQEALDAFTYLSKTEGIIPALESAHAVAFALKLAKKMSKDETLVICLSGRGDKDVAQVKDLLEGN